jgi:hypothetical protein
LEDKKQNKHFPPFLRAFYNLTSMNDEDDTLDNTYLKDMLKKSYTHLEGIKKSNENEKLQHESKTQQYINANPNLKFDSDVDCKEIAKHFKKQQRINMATEYINSSTVDLNDFVKTTDSFVSPVSWSVLSLFSHSAICEIQNESEDEKKFAFWPTCAPKVNNRNVEINIVNDKLIPDFVDSMNCVWDTQSVRIVPYCVTNDEAKSKIKLGPLIATTCKSSQMDDEDKNKSVEDDDCFAGTLRAEKLQFSEVEKLFCALTGVSLNDEKHILGRCKAMADEDKALIGLSICMNFLEREETYNGLKTPQDWCNLYVRLLRLEPDLDSDKQFPFEPTTMTDLAHKTRMLFLSNHSVRFSFMEGQKRTVASTHTLVGFVPRDKFIFHGDLHENQCTIGGDQNFFNKINSYDNEMLLQQSEDICKATFVNGAKTVAATIIHLKTRSKEFNAETLRICQNFSKSLVQKEKKSQDRTWVHIVEWLLNDNDIENKLCILGHKNSWHFSDDLKTFYREFRELTFGKIFENESESGCVVAACNDLDNVALFLNQDDQDKFVDSCLFKPTKKGAKEKKYKTKIYETYVDFKQIPSPSMVHAICTVFVSVAFGSNVGLKLIQNVATLHGKASSARKIEYKFTYFGKEAEYVPVVSYFYCEIGKPLPISKVEIGNDLPICKIIVHGHPF